MQINCDPNLTEVRELIVFHTGLKYKNEINWTRKTLSGFKLLN